MKPEIATTNIIYKSQSPIGTSKTDLKAKLLAENTGFQSPIGTNKTPK
jgi:hypothetical protein